MNIQRLFSRKSFLNLAFLFICAIILLVLLMAPKETTTPLPHDDIHQKFYQIDSKKEAEKFCLDCHDQNKEVPLPPKHPPKFRCLFCHKRK